MRFAEKSTKGLMIIYSTAPSRISLLGGGSDLDSYAKLYGGKVLSMAINLRTHVTLKTNDDIWGETKHHYPPNCDPKLLYAILDKYGMNGLHHARVMSSFDGEIGAGLGSSASFAVAMIAALRRYQKLSMDKNIIAQEAANMEIDTMGWYGGRQDQYASTYGGCNLILFNKEVKVTQLERSVCEKLQEWMVLIYLGGKRDSYKIQKKLEKLTKKQKQTMDAIKAYVIGGIVALHAGNMELFADILDCTWQLKKEFNPQKGNENADDIYEVAKRNGAIGGKLLGAGGGGYFICMVDPIWRKQFISCMADHGIEETDFNISWDGVSTRII